METTTASSNTTITQVFNDKPDELVSPGILDASQQQQIQSQQEQPPIMHQQQTTQDHQSTQQMQIQQQQQKKCLHQRIFNSGISGSVADRIAALLQQTVPGQQTQQQYRPQQQVHQTQSHLQFPTIHQIQHPTPQIQQQQQPAQNQQQMPSMPRMSRHLVQQQPQQLHHQSISNNVNSNIQSNGQILIGSNTNTTSSGYTNNNNNNNNSNNSVAGINNNTQVIHNQNGLVQPVNAALLAERYLLMDLVEGSTLYKCIDIKTREELVSKVSY